MADPGPSATASEFAASEMPVSEGDATPCPTTGAGFPPYPPYSVEVVCPSLADAILAGRDIRIKHKSMPPKPSRPPPKMARPRGPKATDVKMSRQANRAYARCLRRHNAVLTDRLERMSKPLRRNVINFWREKAEYLPASTINRLRAMLDADEPFKPDQAYEYFINLKKSKKKNKTKDGVRQVKKGLLAMCADKRFAWARNATVAFARGIQQRLSRPGRYALADGMLRLSNIIMGDLCSYMNMRTPSRRNHHPKAKFMMEMSDKIAVWIDEILCESDDRMLMMDFDEDDEVNQSFEDDVRPEGTPPVASGSGKVSMAETTGATGSASPTPANILHPGGPGGGGGGGVGFADDFLNMMGGGGLLQAPTHAYLKFSGPMLMAFNILTDSMMKKGTEQLLEHGKFKQTYAEGADELKSAPDFEATEFDTRIAQQLNSDLSTTVAPNTPADLVNPMKEIVNICSNYLAQNAEYNKDKGKAFHALVKAMKDKGSQPLHKWKKVSRDMAGGAKELEKAKGLESNHDDPNLSQEIHGKLHAVVAPVPAELRADMTETLDLSSKYLSELAVDEDDRGPAFHLLIKTLEDNGGKPFAENPHLATNYDAAAALKSAPGLSSAVPDPATSPMYNSALHKTVDTSTPPKMTKEMNDTVSKCADYLSGFARDRDKALMGIIEMMKKNPTKEAAKRNDYAMNYGDGAKEIETAPNISAFLPVKDIADEVKAKLTADMENKVPPQLTAATATAVNDCAKYLSQPIALRSKAAGERYPLNFLSAIMSSLGKLPLFKYKGFGQSYGDAAETLKYSGPLESDPKSAQLASQISAELNHGIPKKLAPGVASSLTGTGVLDDAAQHLAKQGMAKGNAMEHLTGLMKAKGDAPLGVLQGYEQNYEDAARRIENAGSLANDKVDKGAYTNVSTKLTALDQEKPSPEHAEHMPGLIEDSSKFLSAPLPDNEADKRKLLADLMARKGNNEFDKEKMYPMSYTEAGLEIENAPIQGTTAKNRVKAAENMGKINDVIPNKKLQDVLKDGVREGAAHLANTVDARGEAMQEIHNALKKEGDKEFMAIGKFSKSHTQTADMVADAKQFGGHSPHPGVKDKAKEQLGKLEISETISPAAKECMPETRVIASEYIGGIATRESGLDAQGLTAAVGATSGGRVATVAGAGAGAGAAGAGAAGAGAAGAVAAGPVAAGPVAAGPVAAGPVAAGAESAKGSPTETDEERADRLEAERRRKLGLPAETYQERLDRLEAERRRRLGLPPETAEERATRLEAERRKRLGLPPETEAERLARQKLERERRKGGLGDDTDRESAQAILQSQLKAKGNETFYKQPQTELTYAGCADWLQQKPPYKVDKTVRESGDASRLSKKFERKLSNLVLKVTPSTMQDTMQDVVIESARNVAEVFVSKNYKTQVKEGLIAEMQKKGNEILIEENGVSETCFFAAQRLKKAKSYEAGEPCDHAAYYITKKLDEIIRCRTMPRKLSGIMKEHVKEAAAYLSGLVTKPEPDIEAYVALLGEMEVTGDALLIEGDIPKSYKDAAAYLRTLTTYEDQINRSDAALQGSIEAKLKSIMANVPPRGYQSSHMSSAITYATKLLVSYIKLQGEKTEALKYVTERLKEGGGGVLLRHGVIRKSYADGADLLEGKNADQLNVTSAEPVVARKIQIKLVKLVHDGTVPAKYQGLIDDLIEDITMYLAVNLLQPRVIQVCKCMKNVFVQCEIWCDEILRRVARPCCTCSRHVSAAALSDLSPAGPRLRILPGHTTAIAPGLEISIKTCPAHRSRSRVRHRSPCPANKATPECLGNINRKYDIHYSTCEHYCFPSSSPPLKDQAATNLPDYQPSTSARYEMTTIHPQKPTSSKPTSPRLKRRKSLVFDINAENLQNMAADENAVAYSSLSSGSTPSYHTSTSNAVQSDTKSPFWQAPTMMFATCELSHTEATAQTRTPIVSTDQMADWHAMMVSLMWNVQAWREWIQENIDRALSYQWKTGPVAADAEDNWVVFQRRVATEALQWRQYNIFSRQLTLRLAMRYKDKRIVSPTRATNQTGNYLKCQVEMLKIIEMFNRWTQWLTAVVQETSALSQTPGYTGSMDEVRWKYFKNKVLEYLEDWMKYNNHLKVCWENKYKTNISDWLPAWRQPGPVWVVSACGAVPSGAVSAGVYDNEVIWVARTTHRCNVLPAALHPSKHCCVVYADGGVHQYTKYQVMCNAEVQWQAWRAGGLGARAVRVAPGTHVGRVHYRNSHLIGAVYTPNYRCHVVIFGRPFAFNCYELLVLKKDEEGT